ncbi:hypothetical protein [Actinomadura sp. HBU206391]|uniref:hypothetical protein n=1 Tax=Actinomadura sp. HBU206391 TaxID=2731692 RepID=UPI0016500A52|nr:hypothetical protein [Actinomadura sp. HBU206391]MBC6462042.1 hypothetical protein [Actinomadura sp. HBU206391]
MTPAFATPHPDDSHQDLSLPASGWDLHVGRGPHLRPALEVHTSHGLVDIAVAGGFETPLVRGALRGRRMTHRWALAWGHLPSGTEEVVVEFHARRGSEHVTATLVAGAFWVAEAPGSFRAITVAAMPALSAERVRLRRHRS